MLRRKLRHILATVAVEDAHKSQAAAGGISWCGAQVNDGHICEECGGEWAAK